MNTTTNYTIGCCVHKYYYNRCYLLTCSEPAHLWPCTALYSWWWVRLSPETCRVKTLRIKNAIVASCWTYFTTIKHDARNHKYKINFVSPWENFLIFKVIPFFFLTLQSHKTMTVSRWRSLFKEHRFLTYWLVLEGSYCDCLPVR